MLLLGRGANVEVANKNGMTPLMAAAFGGNAGVVTALLERGAKKEVKDKDGMTAQMLAVQKEDAKVVAVLSGVMDAERAPLPDEDEDL